MDYLIGIDDTDNLESRGTGHLARTLGLALEEAGLGQLQSITRHQLLVHPDIRYTSHNSSACLILSGGAALDELEMFCAAHLLRESAAGADAGLCVLPAAQVAPGVKAFGLAAKREVLSRDEAVDCASRSGARLSGLTGDGGGVIGALAAVGLAASGDDGRLLWLPGLRELAGTATVAELRARAHIEAVQTADGAPLEPHTLIDLGDWVRPIMQGGKTVLFVENQPDDAGCWRVAARDLIKQRSE